MRNDIIVTLEKDNDYFIYLRENPYWHKILSRHPEELSTFIEEYKLKRRKRLVDRIEDLSMMVTLAKELL